MQPFADEIRRLLHDEREQLLALADRVSATTQRYSDEELHQLLNGFEAMVVEALEGRGTQTRDLFVETAIPAVLAAGESPSGLVHNTVGFAILLTTHLLDSLPPEHRTEAGDWLAHFFADYCARLTGVIVEQR